MNISFRMEIDKISKSDMISWLNENVGPFIIGPSTSSRRFFGENWKIEQIADYNNFTEFYCIHVPDEETKIQMLIELS